MDFSVKLEGLDRLASKSKIVAKIAAEEVLKGLESSARMVEATAKESLAEGGKAGRIYKRGGKTHQASAPGQAPATDSGDLVNHINRRIVPDQLTAEVYARIISGGRNPTNYAYELEFGNSRVAARPFLFPALEKNKPAIRKRIEKSLDKTIDRATKVGLKSIGK